MKGVAGTKFEKLSSIGKIENVTAKSMADLYWCQILKSTTGEKKDAVKIKTIFNFITHLHTTLGSLKQIEDVKYILPQAYPRETKCKREK